MEGCPGAAEAMDLGVDFLAAQVVGEVDADPVKGAGVELHWGSGYGLTHGFLAALGDRGRLSP